jgi:superfamily II DNA or RNA helicase
MFGEAGRYGDNKEAIGIQIYDQWVNALKAIQDGYHGLVVTYQQLVADLDPKTGNHVFQQLCRDYNVSVFFDEAHHLGEAETPQTAGWTVAALTAFAQAKRRILLSGTPWRADGRMLPWVTYKKDGDGPLMAVPDTDYRYWKAVRDGHVCEVVTFCYDGTFQYISGVDTMITSFKDELGNKEDARRYRAALDIDQEAVETLLREADHGIPNLAHPVRSTAVPAGLVICPDQRYARAIQQKLERISGDRRVSIAISEDADYADEVIERFKTDTNRWLVTVNKVSEGVDIPRIKVIVYLTDYRTEAYFQQVVGRAVRKTKDKQGNPDPEDQIAYLYMLADPQLMEFARRLAAESQHGVKEAGAQMLKRLTEEGLQESERQPDFFRPLSAQVDLDTVLTPDREAGNTDHAGPIWMALEAALRASPDGAAYRMDKLIPIFERTMLHLDGQAGPPIPPALSLDPAPAPIPAKRMQEEVTRLKKELQGVIRQIGALQQPRPDLRKPYYQALSGELIAEFGEPIPQVFRPEDVQARLDYLRRTYAGLLGG